MRILPAGAIVLMLWAAPSGADAPRLRRQVSDDFLIQLGAERSEAEAARSWIVIRNKAGAVLDGLEPKITPVKMPHKGRLYRLRAGPVDLAGAASICTQLKAVSVDCIVVH